MAADADAVYVDGIDSVERLEPVEGAPGLLVPAGERRIEVIRRTGSVALRFHDPKSANLQAYQRHSHISAERELGRHRHGTGRTNNRSTLTTGAVVEGLEHHHASVGVIDFELAGAAQQLVAFERS